ncbi:MAG: 4Fe-4S binding protein [Candidatus Omnitrophota bacterium]
MKKLVFLRRLSQASFFLIFVYALWFTTYPLRGYVSPGIFFKIDPLVTIMTSISERVFLSGIIFSIAMVAATLILGRFFCGWCCPLGSAVDLVGLVNRKKALSKKISRMPKFFILASIFAASFMGFQTAWIADPIVIMARFISLNLIPFITGSIDRFFIIAIKGFGFYGGVYDIYRGLKSTVLGVRVSYFNHAIIVFLFFLAVILPSIFYKRIWCRMICPLGALYALVSRFSIFKRRIDGCIKCGNCRDICRMGAIKDDFSYLKGECILCMDCVYDCPPKAASFTPFYSKKENKIPEESSISGISRQGFIFIVIGAFLSLTGFRNRRRAFSGASNVLRPPLALKEDKFLDRCIRCGNCMKACITNGLQPVLLESGLQGIWTPRLVPEIGYCEYSCTLCGNVCPTGAIPKINIEEKKKAVLGIARIDRSMCLPWAQNTECIVCEEHCPIPKKAIKVEEITIGGKILKRPYVDSSMCVGCGICQNKCPVRPGRAIRVFPDNAVRPG